MWRAATLGAALAFVPLVATAEMNAEAYQTEAGALSEAERAAMSVPLIRRPGRAEFRPTRIRAAGLDGLPVAELMAPNFAARIALLASADGLALIPADADRLDAGAHIDFLRF